MAEQLHATHITKCDTKRWMWCEACCHWTLEQWKHLLWRDESCFSVWRSDGRGCNLALSIPAWLFPSAHRKVHKDMVGWVWCGRTWLAHTEPWPQPHRTPLGWTEMEIVSQAFNITAWSHKFSNGWMGKNDLLLQQNVTLTFCWNIYVIPTTSWYQIH